MYPSIAASALCLLLCACGSSKPASPRRPTPTPTHTPNSPTHTPASNSPNRPTLPVQTDQGHIQWVVSERLMPVLEEAEKVKKPVFVEFHATWCAPCKVMEEEVFTQPVVYRTLNNSFVNFRADYDSSTGRTIADIYEVKTLPTVLFLDGNGVVLERYTGMATVAKMQELTQSALRKNN
jgi:thiol:disulfide interchange protein